MIGNIIKEYRLITTLGEGGMATVYLAEHQLLQHKVAIKVLNDDYVRNANVRKRFIAEAKSLANLYHHNIIRVVDMIDAGDIVAFMMEYVEGQTLGDFILRNGPMHSSEILHFCNQMLDALEYVHGMGLIHRDIKPSNFMVTKDRKIKLLDFGIAKNMDAGSVEYTTTGMLQLLGTPMYMSPEQIKSTKSVTTQSDIYSLGVVLWQMCTGRKPYNFQNDSIYEIQTKIVNELLVPTNSIFEMVIQKATAKEVKYRYSSCNEFRTAINNVQHSSIENPYKKEPPEVHQGFKYSLIATLIVGCIIVAVLFIYQYQKKPSIISDTDIIDNASIGKATEAPDPNLLPAAPPKKYPDENVKIKKPASEPMLAPESNPGNIDDVSASTKQNIISIINNYYDISESHDCVQQADFFVPVVDNYFNEINVTTDQIIQNCINYNNRWPYQRRSMEQSSFLFHRLNNQDYIVSYQLYYQIKRNPNDTWKEFHLKIQIIFTPDLKIKSINETQLAS